MWVAVDACIQRFFGYKAKELFLETFIIRIYRRLIAQPEQILGVSEHVETGRIDRFENIDQLNGLLLDSTLNQQQGKKCRTFQKGDKQSKK